jgi:hypothetical protein
MGLGYPANFPDAGTGPCAYRDYSGGVWIAHPFAVGSIPGGLPVFSPE